MPPLDGAFYRLFPDDTNIADSAFVTRTWHSPRKYPEPVLSPDPSGKGASPVLYGSVLFRNGRFHMWYLNWSRQPKPFACYAVSDDGIHWERPALNLLDPGPYPANAFLRSAHPDGLIDDLTVIEDPEDGEWPLKMLYYDMLSAYKVGGIFAARSRDGIHWENLSPDRVLAWGDRFNAFPRRLNGRFTVYGRARRGASAKGRTVWRAESEDLLHWSEPELVLTRDAEDPPDREIYSLVPFPYGDLTLGGIERMEMSPDTLDTELAWSRDGGRTWRRPRTRPAFLERGAPGAFDDTWINLSANAPIRRDNMLWFYYSGRSGAHYSPFPLNRGGIGLALLRADGFVSLRAGSREGWVLTEPMVWPGGDLMLNADTRRDLQSHPGFAQGKIDVEALDPEGQAIEGFGRADVLSYTGNSVQEKTGGATIRWKNDRALSQLAGRPLRLRFFLRDAHLYGYKPG